MKEKIKKILIRLGLLLFVKKFFKMVLLNDLGSVVGFKYYFYNHWITNLPNHSLRIFYLRHVIGIQIGQECFIHMGCFFEGNNIFIGNNTVIGRNCYLGGSGGTLTIKNNVSITAQTYIFCATHLTNSSTFECTHKDVIIEDYAFIGARAMILPGVRIGKGAILGAASTATKNIPDYSVYAGAPAKEVGKRNQNLIYKLQYSPFFQ